MLLSRKCLSVITVAAVLSLSGSAFAATPKCPQKCQDEISWYWHAQLTLTRQWFATLEHNDAHQVCVRAHESDTAGGYTAYDGSGNYGAYQDDEGTWNSAALASGRPDLVGANILTTPWWDQENVNWTLFVERHDQPWGGRCPMS